MTSELLSRAALLLTAVTAGVASEWSGVYQVVLDQEAKHKMYWRLNREKDEAQFGVHVRIKPDEWFALGFSDRGELSKGDYCVYVPNKNGSATLMNIWTCEACHVHNFDKRDNICSRFRFETGEVVKVVFTRPYNKCTPHHYQIEDATTHVVWALGSGPVIGTNLCDLPDHGMTRVQLVKPPGVDERPPLPPSTWIFNPKVRDVQVPGSDTTYWCHTLPLPEALRRRHHVIRAERDVTEGNDGLVHHMELFHCEVPKHVELPVYNGRCEDKPKPLTACSKVISAWAMGAGPFIYPKEVGLPVGGKDFKLYAMLELHYNNPRKLENWVDSSGFKVYMTPQLRPNDAGIIELGLEYVDKMAIPPRQPVFELSGYCLSDCTKKLKNHKSLESHNYVTSGHVKGFTTTEVPNGKVIAFGKALPSGGIHVFGSQLHTHLTGVMLETRHFRNGKELATLNSDYHYSPHFQEIRLLKEKVHVLPGDTLIHTCYYNTVDRFNITLGGFATTDEMCVNYIYYYPKTDLEVCKSSISDDYLARYFDQLNKWEDQPTGSDLPISQSWQAIEWNQMRARVLAELYNSSPMYMQCNNSAGERYPGDWSHKRPDEILSPRIRDANSCHDDVQTVYDEAESANDIHEFHTERANRRKRKAADQTPSHDHSEIREHTMFLSKRIGRE